MPTNELVTRLTMSEMLFYFFNQHQTGAYNTRTITDYIKNAQTTPSKTFKWNSIHVPNLSEVISEAACEQTPKCHALQLIGMIAKIHKAIFKATKKELKGGRPSLRMLVRSRRSCHPR